MRLLACCYNDPEMQIDPDTVYPIRPDCRLDAPKTRFKPRAGLTLSPKRWKLLHNEEGVLDIAGVIKRVQRGGIHPTIKGEVWEFLLGCYDPKSTTEQRNQLRQQRRLEYEKLKTKCREMDTTVGSGRVITMPVITEDGQPIADPNADGGARPSSVGSEQQTTGAPLPKEVIQWKLTLHQIGLDVNRTDRVLVYYESQENLARLWDILSVYSWVDKDIGYCQGMSDLCSPISIILEHEADAFWCFERLMHRVVQSFGATCLLDGSKKAISTFWNKGSSRSWTQCTFGSFKTLQLMWSMEYNPNLFSMLESDTGTSKATTMDESVLRQCGKFERKNLQADKKDEEIPLSVFVVASVLEARNKKLLGEAKGLDDVVKILNEITGSLDAKKACREALQIHEKYLNTVKA
ncbi:GTPase-activating protein GYP7-like isoform X3 [Panicum hallii]|uniref:GTPase-activating protein GYP7-like isoform X3 n=1 Tax=Panicum hallii TaxID=206008 RepID=UPI000DF4D725|nr:GTPase-activating protein GYP7-like isoform X3 [Panicum hallii]